MAGSFLEVRADDKQVLAVIGQALNRLGDLTLPFSDTGKALELSHEERWRAQVSPGGTPWQALSPGYRRRKKKNADKILVLNGYLKLLHYQASPTALLFGSNMEYAAIHQFGGDIKHFARSQRATFRIDQDTGRSRFAKRSNANFEQWVTMGEHTTHIPARPFLGLSESDKATVLEIFGRYLLK